MAKKKASKKPVASKKTAKKTVSKGSLSSLESKSKGIVSEIEKTRKDIEKNESVLKGLIGKRSSLEDKMNDILGKDFESEKRLLEQITSSSKKRQKDLQAQIKSLRNITSIYDAKKAKISEAKKRELALRDQLKALSKKAGAWG